MSFDFIHINRSILDYSEYVHSVMLLKNYLKHKLIEILLEENFTLEIEKSPSYNESELLFYNCEKDLEIKILIKKRGDETFA